MIGGMNTRPRRLRSYDHRLKELPREDEGNHEEEDDEPPEGPAVGEGPYQKLVTLEIIEVGRGRISP